MFIEWDIDALNRKYKNTYAKLIAPDGSVVSPVGSVVGFAFDDNKDCTYVVYHIIGQDVAQFPISTTKCPLADEEAYSLEPIRVRTGYLHHGTKLRYISRKVDRSFCWGAKEEDYRVVRVYPSAGLSTTASFFSALGIEKSTPIPSGEFTLFSPAVVKVGKHIYMHDTLVGFVEDMTISVRSAAVAKLLSTLLDPSWKINRW